MFELHTIEALIKSYGLILLFPLAVIEGPIVTVIAAYLARLNYFSLTAVCIVVIIADLVGDLMFYAIGNWLVRSREEPPRWLARLGLNKTRLKLLIDNFEHRGGRTIIIGKLTHSASVVVLIAAGMAHMRLVSYLFYNTLATIPKSLFFVAIGYSFGHFAAQIDGWIAAVSLLLLILLIMGLLLWRQTKKSL